MVDRKPGYSSDHEAAADQQKAREALTVFGEVSVKYPASIGGQAVLIEQRCRQGGIKNFQSAEQLLQYLLQPGLTQQIADKANYVHGEVSQHRQEKPEGKPLSVREITAESAQAVIEEEIDLAKQFSVFTDQDLEELLEKVKQPTVAEVMMGKRTSDLVTHIARLTSHRQKKSSGQQTPTISHLADPDSHYY